MLTRMRTHQAGFSLIELLVGIAILGILASVAIPSFRTWILNLEIKNAAESITSGLQKTRAEALKRNTNVEFTVSADGSWTIMITTSAQVLEQHSGSEGSKNVTVATTGGNTATYDSLGRTIAPSFTQVDIDSSVLSAADSNNLRVTVQLGGSVRMCDPNIAAPDPRAC
ncbi:MAG: GspH/FimT family pseudopilin [Pseudomonadota bacterium]